MTPVINTPLPLIYKTPILRLKNIERRMGLSAHLYAKAECYSPLGSVKDRVALAMISDAERRGLISGDSVIIEPTSGNTGIGIALVSASRGYRAVIVMPESASVERQRIISSLGGTVVLSDATLGMSGAVDMARALAKRIEHSYMPNQFENPQNPLIHKRTTAPEIFSSLRGRVDIFVAGVGTGGTISGVGRYLKEKNTEVQIIAVEPSQSAVMSGGVAGAHSIEGIGAGFIPDTLDLSVIDRVMTVSDYDAKIGMELLIKTEGVYAGLSSGAVLFASLILAGERENFNKNIVTVFPDSFDRYVSKYFTT